MIEVKEHPGPCKCARPESPNYNCQVIPKMYSIVGAVGPYCGCGEPCICIVYVHWQGVCSCR